MVKDLVILGAAGDLTSRYLMPALARLIEAGALTGGISILGASLEPWGTTEFRNHVAEALHRHAAGVDPAAHDALVRSLEYRVTDVTDGERIGSLLAGRDQPLVLYLALPPAVAGAVVAAIAPGALPAGTRIVFEKPFGSDLRSAQELNRSIRERFPERDVFRVDHFLMKQTIQNVLGIRFANHLFEPLWNRDHVERVDVVWDETVGLEQRAGYYDRAGALRDMIQNHLLQILCLIGMEPPLSMGERDLRDRKVDLLRAVRRPSAEDVARWTVRGRYSAGAIDAREVPAYADEEGIEPSRETETYARVTLFVDNWRWSGVPFVLRTGKAMARNRREVVVHLRPVPHLAFQPTQPCPNRLRLLLDPDRVVLELNVNGLGDPFDLETIELDADLGRQDLPAYARLLLDVMQGNTVLSIRGDEAEESWRIAEPILDAWRRGVVPLLEYPAGSDGPEPLL